LSREEKERKKLERKRWKTIQTSSSGVRTQTSWEVLNGGKRTKKKRGPGAKKGGKPAKGEIVYGKKLIPEETWCHMKKNHKKAQVPKLTPTVPKNKMDTWAGAALPQKGLGEHVIISYSGKRGA